MKTTRLIANGGRRFLSGPALLMLAALASSAIFLFFTGCGNGSGGGGYGNEPVVIAGTISGSVLGPTQLVSRRNDKFPQSSMDDTPVAGVRNAGTKFLGGATVFVEELPAIRVTSGADGTFQLSDVPIDRPLHIIVRYDSKTASATYRMRSTAVSLSATVPLAHFDLPVQQANKTVVLTVSNPRGSPFPGVLVTVWGETRYTDLQGRVTLMMPEGVSEVIVSSPAVTPLSLAVPFVNATPVQMGVTLVPTGSSNRPPQVSLSAPLLEIARGGSVELKATGVDPDGDALTFTWTSPCGRLSAAKPTDNRITWFAPDADMIATVSVTVSDTHAGRGNAALSFKVGIGGENHPPTVSAVADPATVLIGGSVALRATVSDADGDAVTLAWSASAGSFASSTAPTTTWAAPAIGGAYVITLRAADAKGAKAETTVLVTVSSNHPPVASILATGTQITQGGAIDLSASVSDSDGDVVTCAWTTSDGTLSATTGTKVRWTSPAHTGASTVTLTATDGHGGTTTSSIVLNVPNPDNQPPQIQALTPTRTETIEGQNIALTVDAIDADGDPLIYTWSASGGSFTTNTAASTAWIPGSGPATYTVTCTVSDGRGGSASSSVLLGVRTVLSLAVGEHSIVEIGTGKSVLLPTTTGNEQYGLVLFSRSEVPGTYQIDVNGGGKVLSDLRAPSASLRSSPLTLAAPRQIDVDSVMRQHGRRTSPTAGTISANRLPGTPALAEVAIGDQHPFSVWDGGSGRVDRIGELRYVGTQCKIFLDTGSYGNYDTSLTTDAIIASFGQEFDARIYPFMMSNYSDSTVYSRDGDINHDGKVTIFFTPVVNAIGAAGFFDPDDFGTTGATNQRDMFYMWTKESRTSLAWWKMATIGTLVHEFQHLINYVAHRITYGGRWDEESWLDESMSVCSENRYLGSRDERFDDYQIAPENNSLLTWPGNAGLSNYGCVGLFGLYLFEQLGTDTIKALVQTSDYGLNNLNARASSRGGIGGLLPDWGMTMFRWGRGLPAATRYDYILDVALSLKTSSLSLGTSFSASMRDTAFRFIILSQTTAPTSLYSTLTLADATSGACAAGIIRLK
ncbi:MAG: PKD domain-containing protein [Candidatus Ozemobacteraceae bacterium]